MKNNYFLNLFSATGILLILIIGYYCLTSIIYITHSQNIEAFDMSYGMLCEFYPIYMCILFAEFVLLIPMLIELIVRKINKQTIQFYENRLCKIFFLLGILSAIGSIVYFVLQILF